MSRTFRKDWVGYLFVTPMLIGICVFFLYPMISSFGLSLKGPTGTSTLSLTNYKWVAKDPNFWRAVGNTSYMSLMSVSSGVVLPFVLATLIHNVKLWKDFFKSIFFLPNVASIVGTSILFSYIFYPTEQGLMNSLLALLHIGKIGWFTDPAFAPIGIVLMGIWHSVGYNTIIFLAGLQSVPRELYEAAEVDGASAIRKWWYITIPYVRSIFVFVIVISTIAGMKRFADVWVIGGDAGNPNGSLLTIVLYIYRNAISAGQSGVGSAAAFILFAIIMILSLANLKAFSRNTVD